MQGKELTIFVGILGMYTGDRAAQMNMSCVVYSSDRKSKCFSVRQLQLTEHLDVAQPPVLMHKIIGYYSPNRYENQCMDNLSGLLKDTGEASSFMSE